MITSLLYNLCIYTRLRHHLHVTLMTSNNCNLLELWKETSFQIVLSYFLCHDELHVSRNLYTLYVQFSNEKFSSKST